MNRKSIIILVAVVALIVVGAFTVMAQDDPTTPPFGRGMMQGEQGWMHRGFGSGMMGPNDESMIAEVAGALGLEPQVFFDAIHSGQTLAEVAEAQGVELQSVYDAVIAHAEERTAARVAAGTLTQAEADEHLTWVREHVSEMPMFSGAGACPCMENGSMSGMGMMGRGHGMMGNGSGMMGQGRWMRGNNS